MNENIDLIKILKNCPIGTEFYSSVLNTVVYEGMGDRSSYRKRIFVSCNNNLYSFTSSGRLEPFSNGECVLFPSKDQRDWSKFTAPWYKKDKFDPKTLKPFDKVLVSDEEGKYEWTCKFFSHYRDCELNKYRYTTTANVYKYCIPYNDDTQHLVGTKDEAPEYYRYWED